MYIINEVVWKGKCEKKCNKEKNYKEISWNWRETLKKLIEIIFIKSIWTKIGRHRVNLVKKKKKSQFIFRWKKSESGRCSVVSNSLWPHRLYSPWNSSGQNPGVGSLSLLQGIFPARDWTQASCMQVDPLPVGQPMKPKRIRVGSLSLL